MSILNDLKKLAVPIFMLVVVICLFLFTRETGISDEKIKGLLVNCSRGEDLSPNALDYKCLRDSLYPIINKKKLSTVVASLEKVFLDGEENKEIGTLSCHGPSHLVGEIAYAKGISEAEIYESCGTHCDYGCVHGAFLEMARSTPDFLENYPNICEHYEEGDIPKDLISCYHITGHGLVEILGRDIGKTLPFCDRFNEEKGKHNCINGALMEILLGTTEGSVPFDAEKSDIVDFCKNLSANHAKVCYEQAGFYGYTLIEDNSRVPAICNRVPTSFRKDCFQNLGIRAYLAYRSSMDDFKNYCSSLGVFSLECILGGVVASVDGDPEFNDSLKICSSEKGEIRQKCFSFLRERLEYAYGVEFSLKACEDFSQEDKKSCLQRYK